MRWLNPEVSQKVHVIYFLGENFNSHVINPSVVIGTKTNWNSRQPIRLSEKNIFGGALYTSSLLHIIAYAKLPSKELKIIASYRVGVSCL